MEPTDNELSTFLALAMTFGAAVGAIAGWKAVGVAFVLMMFYLARTIRERRRSR